MFSPYEKCKELYRDTKQCVFTGRELKMDTIYLLFFCRYKNNIITLFEWRNARVYA